MTEKPERRGNGAGHGGPARGYSWPPFEPGNEVALRHGAQSERRIGRRATVEKRRLLRQIGLRQDDLESVGRALLLNWSRAAAALHLMDDYAAREGWLDAEGNPRGFARLYVSMLNAERHALKALSDHLRTREADPFDTLDAYLSKKYGDGDGDGG